MGDDEAGGGGGDTINEDLGIVEIRDRSESEVIKEEGNCLLI